MGKILEAFANNILNTVETIENHNPQRQKLLEKNMQLYNELLQKLNDEEKNVLEKLLDVISDESCYDAQHNFVRGYYLGTIMTTEIFSEKESFFIK